MSFSVNTPTTCVCKMPDAIEDIDDLVLPDGSSPTQVALLAAGKAAAAAALETDKVGIVDGDKATGYYVTISGHSGEEAGIGDSLYVSIQVQAPTDPPARNE